MVYRFYLKCQTLNTGKTIMYGYRVLIATVILDFRMQNEVSFIAAAFRLFAICFSFEPLHAYFSYDRTFLLK